MTSIKPLVWTWYEDDDAVAVSTRLPWWAWPFVVVFGLPVATIAVGAAVLLWSFYYHERHEL